MPKQGKTVEYRNVKTSKQHLDEMLRWSNGAREVPVIVENGNATIGWDGET